jgi:hypothetical protein
VAAADPPRGGRAGLLLAPRRQLAPGHPAACDLTEDDQTGLILLLGPGAGIVLNDDDPDHVTIYKGRHRITAMRYAGVRRTVIQRSEVTPA